MAECEIGSETWLRERIEHGLDPGEGDRPDAGRLLSFEVEPADVQDRLAEPYSA